MRRVVADGGLVASAQIARSRPSAQERSPAQNHGYTGDRRGARDRQFGTVAGALWSVVDEAFEALACALTSHAELGTNHTPRQAGTVGG